MTFEERAERILLKFPVQLTAPDQQWLRRELAIAFGEVFMQRAEVDKAPHVPETSVYEYVTVSLFVGRYEDGSAKERLNSWGDDGWRVVGVMGTEVIMERVKR